MRRRSEDQTLFDIGRRIAELREDGGHTQQVLADKVGLSPQRLRELEAGAHNPSVRTLYRVAAGLGVEIDALFVMPRSRLRRGPGRPRSKPLTTKATKTSKTANS